MNSHLSAGRADFSSEFGTYSFEERRFGAWLALIPAKQQSVGGQRAAAIRGIPHSNSTIWKGSSETCSVTEPGSGSKRYSLSGLWRLYLLRANSLFCTA